MTVERNLIPQALAQPMITLRESTPRQRAAVLRERCRKMAHKSIVEGVEWMRAKLRDDRTDDRIKLAIVNDLEDRYGTPRSTRVATIDETALATKMIEFKHYDPPPGWSDKPPVIEADGATVEGSDAEAAQGEQAENDGEAR